MIEVERERQERNRESVCMSWGEIERQIKIDGRKGKRRRENEGGREIVISLEGEERDRGR